ncbi:MAG: myo-inosose-2 dehydratase [Proteobacteria bacterium]|nr:myo-inosose-2 dehydratase [Pseudomonadota bacterium]
MRLRIGINPLTWTNDDMPELGGATPLETCLAEAREAGYEGIEMGHKFPRTAAELGPILDRHGLALVSGWYSAKLMERTVEEEIAAVGDHLALLSEMGCKVMVFAETGGSTHGDREAPISARPVLSDDDWAPFGDRLTRVAEHLAARGVAMAYHHHMGTVIETEAEVDRLMACTGEAVGLLLDTGHMSFAGADPAAVAARHGRRINHVHCKDVRADVLEKARGGDMSFLDAMLDGVFTVPGDGAVDFTKVLAALRHSAYSGWLVVEAEQDPAKADPLRYARMGYDGVRSALAAAGL